MDLSRNKIVIEMTAENPVGSGYFYADLQLSATDGEIRDAIQRVRGIGKTEDYLGMAVIHCPFLAELSDIRLGAPTICKINFLAKRLGQLPFEERIILNGVFLQRKESGMR